MKNIVYIAQSLDGYIADKNGGVKWLNDIPNPDNDDFGFADFIADIDAILMGRNTFQHVQSFGVWPYTKPVYVITSSLNYLPDEFGGKAQILNLNPSGIIKRLHNDGLKKLYIDGGALIHSFLAEDLIDELIITTIPIVLGAGIPLFRELNTALKFKHQKTYVLLNSLVKSHYIKQR